MHRLFHTFIYCALFQYSIYAQSLTGKVISVKDGDTIEIWFNGKPLKIRLFGIDCPEKKQDFGTQAGKYTALLCFGKIVSVTDKGQDKYRRTLGIVVLPDGKNLNQELVRNGYAWRYKTSKDITLLKLQEKAQKDKLGLWKQLGPVAPWEYRYNKRKK